MPPQLAAVGFANIFSQFFINIRQSFEQDSRVVVEPHPDLIANGRAPTTHLVRLPKCGNLRGDCLLAFLSFSLSKRQTIKSLEFLGNASPLEEHSSPRDFGGMGRENNSDFH